MTAIKKLNRMAEWLLAGPSLGMPIADTDGIEDIDITMPVHETPNFPQNIETPNFPKVEYVPGNTVRGKYLGWTDYPTAYRPAKIEIPAFDSIMKEVNGRMKHKYAQARQAIHDYILGHEVNVEVAHQPQNQLQHGRFEAEYLANIEGTDAYVAGLALHKKRLSEGSNDEKEFSKETSRNYDLGKAFQKYGAHLDEMVGLVGDVISGKPTYQHQACAGLSGNYKIEDYRPTEPVTLREAA